MAGSGALWQGCAEFSRRQTIDRRGFLKVGVVGSAGLSLAGLLQHEALAGAAASRERSVIILWMAGGPSHLDMWDPKPDAPVEVRGEFGAIGTKVPGIQLSEMLPMSARLMDKWSIVRSLHHRPEDGPADHGSGDQICLTGYPAAPNSDQSTLETIHPSCGAIVAEQLGRRHPELPANVVIPRMIPGTNSAYLGAAYKPFETGADPADAGPFKVRNLQMTPELTIGRLGDRKQLLSDMDRLRGRLDAAGQMGAWNRFEQQAMEMLTSEAAQRAFDLDAEPRAVRERYGFMSRFVPKPGTCCSSLPAWSQRVLLARRLIEAGVRIVTVNMRFWDTHEANFDALRRGHLPPFDKVYTALIEDLQQRGLLGSTLVIAWGEFGRSPRVNGKAGRDHWPGAFNAALAGGRVQGGRVVGSSDAIGAAPKDSPKTPQDVLATLYHHLGIDPGKYYQDNSGRPIPVLPCGEPIAQLF